MGFEELASTASGKERRDTQDILMGSKEPLVGTHAEGNNSRSKVAKSEDKKWYKSAKGSISWSLHVCRLTGQLEGSLVYEMPFLLFWCLMLQDLWRTSLTGKRIYQLDIWKKSSLSGFETTVWKTWCPGTQVDGCYVPFDPLEGLINLACFSFPGKHSMSLGGRPIKYNSKSLYG